MKKKCVKSCGAGTGVSHESFSQESSHVRGEGPPMDTSEIEIQLTMPKERRKEKNKPLVPFGSARGGRP